MVRFRKSYKILILGLNIVHLPHFKHNKNFPLQMCSVTFMCLLNTKFIKKVNNRKNYCDNPVETV